MYDKLTWEHVACALCGSDNARLTYRIHLRERRLTSIWRDGVEHPVTGTEQIVTCRTCGLTYVNPRIVAGMHVAPYSTAQELAYFAATRPARLRAYHELLQHVPTWYTSQTDAPLRLLDVGCGDGVLLEAAAASGIDALGTEVSPVLVTLVRQQLGTTRVTDADPASLPDASYNIITLLNVIEHVHAPAELLATLARRLVPGGVLLVHAPNFGGLPARLTGKRWHQIEPLGHLYYFTSRTLCQMLIQAGLEPAGRFSLITSRGIPALVQRSLNRLGIYYDNSLGLVARRPG